MTHKNDFLFFTDIKKTCNHLYSRFKKQKLYLKIIITITIFAFFLITSYFGVLGISYQQNVKNVLKLFIYKSISINADSIAIGHERVIKLVDLIREKEATKKEFRNKLLSDERAKDSAKKENSYHQEQILTHIQFTVNNKKGTNAMTCKVNDLIRIYLRTNKKSYIALVAMDSKGILGLLHNENPEPRLYSPMDSFDNVASFYLDSNRGFEIYYAISSYEKFNFTNDILPLMVNIHDMVGNIKGRKDYPFYLNLPDGFYQDFIFFYHQE